MASVDGAEGMGQEPHTYQPPMPRTWWLRHRNYLLYVLRDLSPLPPIVWLLVFLYDVRSLSGGPAAFHAHTSPWFIAFSVFCFACVLLHAITWLILAGVVLRLPPLSSRTISGVFFGVWAIASIVIASSLVWLGR